MTDTNSPKMRTSDVLRALADQLDALSDVLDHPITATVYDFGHKHEVAIQPFGDDDQRDAALTYAIAAKLEAKITVRELDEAKVSVQFATEFSGVELTMFAHVGRKAADRAARDAEEQAAREYEAHEANEAWLDAHPDESHFTRAQLDGEACTECGVEFVEGEPTVPSGFDFIEGQLFAHLACTESEADR